jgi:predicted translin family RNA/ssDNA-binding protein
VSVALSALVHGAGTHTYCLSHAHNNIDVASEYISKLRQELEGHAERLFTSASEQDRLRRCGSCDLCLMFCF